MNRAIVFPVLCLVLLSWGAFAQSPNAAPTPAAFQAAPTGASTTAYTLPPDKLAKAKALYHLRGRLLIIETIYGFVVLLAILYFGIVARYRDWAEKAFKYSFLQALIVVPLYSLTTDLLDLPFGAYGHHIGLQYGLSVQQWGSWFSDAAKGWMISAVAGTLLFWLMIFIIRRSPRRWWFYFWLILQPIIVLLFIAEPLIIDPLFNKFEPLDKSNPQLVDAIERVTRHRLRSFQARCSLGHDHPEGHDAGNALRVRS
jgi:STE24 endopeptidase